MNFKKYYLKEKKVIDYLSKRFESYNYLISKFLKECDFTKGQFYTLFPAGVKEKQLYDFESGGILQVNDNSEDSLKWLSRIIQDDLNKNAVLIWLFEDALRNASDDKKSLDFFYNNKLIYLKDDKVFYIVDKENSSFENIYNCVDNTNIIWYYISILTVCPQNLSFGKQLSNDQITFCCINTKKLIFGAYDMEGYIFWEKIQ